MTIFGITLQTDQIIGISGLWVKNHPTQKDVTPKLFDLNFKVILKTRDVAIHSDYFSMNPTPSAIITWQLQYCEYYRQLCVLIKEPIPEYITRLEYELKIAPHAN